MKELKSVAREALETFQSIDRAAVDLLQQRGLNLGALAVVNQATAETIAANMHQRNLDRTSNLHELRRKPAIARLVIADEDDRQETLYIAPNAEVSIPGVKLCSYLNNAGKGKLASFNPGDGTNIKLPSGVRYFEVLEKITFDPICETGEWDARPAIAFQSQGKAQSIKSLRALLREAGVPEDVIDEMERLAESSEDDGNVFEGIAHQARTAMELRLAPLLDKFQSEIFRLPITSRIAVMGPPGTGKTTTMVTRLRQKLDLALLDDEELQLVEEPDAAGLDHPDSWILFTPTELLRLYVKEALGRKGVPVHDQRLRTWDDYRREIARSSLRILQTGTGSGLTIREDDALLAPGTLTDQIAWYEAFDAFQRDLFIRQIAMEAERLAKSDDTRVAVLGRRIGEAVDRAGGNVLRLLGEIAGQADDLRTFANGLNEGIRRDIASPGNGYVKRDEGFMDALVNLVTDLQQSGEDADEEDEDADEDIEEANPQSLEGRKLAVDVFRKAMRTFAMSQATGRKPGPTSRAAKIAALITERGLDLPDLSATGRLLILQRAARRIARAPGAFIGSMPLRYRRFRRSMRTDGKWYGEAPTSVRMAHPAEVDLIILAMFQAARAFDADRLLSSRVSPDRRPPILDSIAALRRNQVLVDEVTDFSPVQLAAMAALSAPTTEAVFLSGDFNQRLTVQGTRSEDDLDWSVPGVDVHQIAVSYRQSRKLADYARALARKQGATIEDRAPDYGENIGFDPVCGVGIDTDEKRAEWLARRIREIEAIGNGTLPTVAVLVSDRDAVDALTDQLDRQLAKTNLRARAYSAGNAIGHSQDVRVFSIEHIKGLEFEAVFFADVDRLAEAQPELFDRYIYVGATRAATFLGLTCSAPRMPDELVGADLSYGQSW